MPYYGETTQITVPKIQQQKLLQLAQQDGQDIDELIRQILQEGIDKRRHRSTKAERLQALERIEVHRNAFLARRNNQPLTLDPVSLLDQIRDEQDQRNLELSHYASTSRD